MTPARRLAELQIGTMDVKKSLNTLVQCQQKFGGTLKNRHEDREGWMMLGVWRIFTWCPPGRCLRFG